MKKAFSLVAGVAAAAAPLIMGLAAPTAAAARGGAASARAAAGAPEAAAGREGGATSHAFKSTDFAGYSLQGGGEGRWSVSTVVVVPKVKCGSGKRTKHATRAVAASVGVYGASGAFSAADVFVGCLGSKAAYFPSLEVNTSPTKLRGKNYTKDHIRPGDKVKIAVSQTAAKVTVSVKDMTRKIHVSLHGAGSASGGSPWVGTGGWEVHSKLLRVPRFGKMSFSQSLLDGHPFLVGTARGVARYNRETAKGVLQIKTSPAKHQEDFTTFFKHS